MSLNEDLKAASERSFGSCLPGGPEQGLTMSSGHVVVVALHHQATSATAGAARCRVHLRKAGKLLAGGRFGSTESAATAHSLILCRR